VDFAQNREAIIESGAEIVTGGVRRRNITGIGKKEICWPPAPKRVEDPAQLPRVYTAEDAFVTCRLAREGGRGASRKMEATALRKTMFPDVAATSKLQRFWPRKDSGFLQYIKMIVACLKLQEIRMRPR